MEFCREKHQEFRKNLPTFINEGNDPPLWSFKPADIYQLLDLFIQRLNDLKDIFDVANEFSKLERVEIGGINGRQINFAISKVGSYSSVIL